MRTPGSMFGRWPLYGFIASFLHVFVYVACYLVNEFLHNFQPVPAIGRCFHEVVEFLGLPGVWLHEEVGRDLVRLFPSRFESFYDQHWLGFYWGVRFANSALWGFTIAAVVLYISHIRYTQHENAA